MFCIPQLKAIEDEDLDVLERKLTEMEADKRLSSSTVKTEALYLACTRGSVTVTNLFVRYHSIFDWTTKWAKSSPLLEAARRRHVSVFETLLRHQSFMDYKNAFVAMTDGEGNTLLHIAADVQEDEILKFSLECGVDPMTTNDKGMTPLHYVAMRGNMNACHHLLKCFDNRPSTIASYIESEADKICKENAVYFAAKHNHKSMLKLLLKRLVFVNK